MYHLCKSTSSISHCKSRLNNRCFIINFSCTLHDSVQLWAIFSTRNGITDHCWTKQKWYYLLYYENEKMKGKRESEWKGKILRVKYAGNWVINNCEIWSIQYHALSIRRSNLNSYSIVVKTSHLYQIVMNSKHIP